ncbi:MAG TPA: YozQ family protein [Bacilli bacterium]
MAENQMADTGNINEAMDARIADEEAAGIRMTREQFSDAYAAGTADGAFIRSAGDERSDSAIRRLSPENVSDEF